MSYQEIIKENQKAIDVLTCNHTRIDSIDYTFEEVDEAVNRAVNALEVLNELERYCMQDEAHLVSIYQLKKIRDQFAR